MAIITGTSLDDVLNGTSSDDIITGLAGNDQLNGGLGADNMDGGAGNDFYVVDNLGDKVNDPDKASIQTTINFNLSSVTGNPTQLALSLMTNGITGTGSSGNDLIISYANNTTLIGGDGHDVLIGRTGSTVRGGNGNDVLGIGGNTGILRGGAGNDTYNVSSTSGNLVIDEYTDGAGGIDTIFSLVDFSLSDDQTGVDFISAITIENLTLAVLDVAPGDKLGGPITGKGNNGDNQIIGNRRNNILSGLSGNDTIYASYGNDYVDGGNGNDFLYGEVGNDTLVGGGGADWMDGGIGDDTYYVDNASDLVVDASGNDTVFVSATWSTSAEVETIHVTANGVNITLNNTVGTIIDVVTTITSNNVFTGGSGNDTMNGGVGIDTLTGRNGNDIFGFGGTGLIAGGSGSTSIRQDTITDFSGGDKIKLLLSTFASVIHNSGSLDTNDFLSGDFGSQNLTMGAKTQHIVYNTFNGFLYYNQDGATAGAGSGGFFATVLSGGMPVINLEAADFIVA